MAKVEELMQNRLEKLNKLKEYGINEHPDRYEVTHSIEESRKLEDGTKNVSVAGRLMSKRKMGKMFIREYMKL